MKEVAYSQLQITETQAEKIALEVFDLSGRATRLDGEIDFNYKIKCENNKSYILKISRPNVSLDYLSFQDELFKHLEKNAQFNYPKAFRNTNENIGIFNFIDSYGNERKVRLFEWINGRLYSTMKPKSEKLRFSLGQRLGEITYCLLNFEHHLAQRSFDWNLSDALWVENYIHLFTDKQLDIISFFIDKFKSIQDKYKLLRKSVIHNDANDNNILVDENDLQSVTALIDYGDSVYSQTINDLSVVLAYGLMDFEQPLEASRAIIAGYHKQLPLLDDELQVLYVTTAMRLVISVTKSAINKKKEPDNLYLLCSEKAAWSLLEKWMVIPANLAYYSFRSACGMTPCNKYDAFIEYSQNVVDMWSIEKLMPSSQSKNIGTLDLSVSSKFVGNFKNYLSTEILNEKIAYKIKEENALLMGGYGEVRPFYTTDAYKITTNEGYEHRTIHIGVDFWTEAKTSVHVLEDAEVYCAHNNDNPKDYGPTLILKHSISSNGLIFYTLYGHLTRESLFDKFIGKQIKKGEKLCEVGFKHENGGWSPHLHFQIILDMLDMRNDFIGVSTPNNWPIFASICPDPNFLFKCRTLTSPKPTSISEQLLFRREHLGKSLSLSYDKPLKVARGEMQYLIDESGQKYLDTVNNVAHVGHEHSSVVEAGQEQMAILNTNTRYMNDEILEFTAELLRELPPELSVLHFVNSGSEANELALRMARTFTGHKDVIALQIGYHGNTQGCIDVSSYKFDGKGGKGCPEDTHIVPLPDTFRGIYRGENTAQKYAQHIQRTIDNLKVKRKGVAAFIAESIVSCGGQIDLPKGYLAEASKHVKDAGGVYIADEVQVGFGRVGKCFWGFQLHDILPDIVTMGKPIGNGHPLGAVACTREIANAFANGMEFFNTFGGNPVSCSIGRKVLQVIKEDKLQENALDVGNYLKNRLKELQKMYSSIIGDVRGEGLFLGVEFADENKKPLSEQTNYVINRMKDFKILMSLDGPQHNVIKIKPPMCFNKENANYLLDVLKTVLDEIRIIYQG